MFKQAAIKIFMLSLTSLALPSFSGIAGGNTAWETGYEKLFEVFVIQARWHTGIILKTADIDRQVWPETDRYRDRNFVDTGWGDEKFYQATGDPVFLAARAVLWPTQSVLQVFAFNTPLRSAYGRQSRILRIPVTEKQLTALSGFVSESYVRDDNGLPVPSTVYGETDHYFLATKKYHLFRTCNTWVAIAFRQSGLNVRSFGILNANQLFRQLSRLPGAEFME